MRFDESHSQLSAPTQRDLSTQQIFQVRVLFEEPGALGRVSRLACDWFDRYLREDSR